MACYLIKGYIYILYIDTSDQHLLALFRFRFGIALRNEIGVFPFNKRRIA